MAVAAIKAQQGGGFKRQLDLTVSRQYTMPEDDILKAGELGRQTISVSGVTWPARSVVLTSNAIYFGRPGTKKVLDVVPLLEIQSVEPVGVVLKGAAKADADDDGPGGEDCCFRINPNEDAESFSGRALVDRGAHSNLAARCQRAKAGASLQDGAPVPAAAVAAYSHQRLDALYHTSHERLCHPPARLVYLRGRGDRPLQRGRR